MLKKGLKIDIAFTNLPQPQMAKSKMKFLDYRVRVYEQNARNQISLAQSGQKLQHAKNIKVVFLEICIFCT